jgi:hypothetical protein
MLILLLMGELVTQGFAAKIRQIVWQDLKVKIEFEDPFAALTRDQLYDLSTYARVSAMQAQGSDRVTESMFKEAQEAEKALRKEGIDIEGLLTRREEIKALRARRARAVNHTFDGVSVRMPGYALPLEYDGKKITEFLLVPWVGACIHTPPPPPNQIVYVRVNEGIESHGRFTPVWVTGEMTVKTAIKNLFLVDGSAGINIGYSLRASLVEPYK